MRDEREGVGQVKMGRKRKIRAFITVLKQPSKNWATLGKHANGNTAKQTLNCKEQCAGEHEILLNGEYAEMLNVIL